MRSEKKFIRSDELGDQYRLSSNNDGIRRFQDFEQMQYSPYVLGETFFLIEDSSIPESQAERLKHLVKEKQILESVFNEMYKHRFVIYRVPDGYRASLRKEVQEIIEVLLVRKGEQLEAYASALQGYDYSGKDMDEHVEEQKTGKNYEGMTDEEIRRRIVIDETVDYVLEHADIVNTKPEFCIDFLRVHVQRHKELLEKQKTELETIKNSAYEYLRSCIERGRLPVSIDRLDKVFRTTAVHYSDPFVGAYESLGGTYDGRLGIINIVLLPGQSQEYRKNVLIHEYLHALSGLLFVVSEFEEDDVDNDDIPYEYKFPHVDQAEKVGAVHKGYFRWLNEALTEHAVWIEQGNDIKKGGYRDERALLLHLVSLGLDLDAAYRMYFESWGESQDETHSMPDTRNFFHSTNNTFGKAFFIKLDRYLGSREEEGFSKKIRALLDCTSAQDLYLFLREEFLLAKIFESK
jgi:hypothetical protein